MLYSLRPLALALCLQFDFSSTLPCFCNDRPVHTIHRSCLINFIIVLAASEMTKTLTGALRPNFLARCQPDPAQLAQPFSFQETVRCTNPDTDMILQVSKQGCWRHVGWSELAVCCYWHIE